MIATILVLHLAVNAYGVPGRGTIVADTSTRRFARRFEAGPASEQEGFDGRRAWRADATGMLRIQGNTGERSEILQWSQALSNALSGSRSLNGTFTQTIAGATDRVTLSFERFRRFGSREIPTRILSRSEQNGMWTADVHSVQFASPKSAALLRPPNAAPHDFQLAGISRIPVSMDEGSPVLDAVVNGKHLRFLFDTGGQNVLTTESAQALGLQLLGHGTVGGGGGGTSTIRYATVKQLQIGDATLFNQPFIVLPADALPAVDGIVGYELLARFSARLDMAHGVLELAPRAGAFGPSVAPAQFEYFDRQPQVSGSLDSIGGAFSIDTGSSLNAQIQTPVVRKYDLVNRLHATVATYASDVGGRYPIYLVRAGAMRLGNALFPAPIVNLLTRASTSNDASIIANVGDGILRRWILVFDYPHRLIDFRPGGDTAGNVFRDHSGALLGAKGSMLVIRQVLGGTPAADSGLQEGAQIVSVNGSAVTAQDLMQVRSLLRGTAGTTVRLQLADGSTHDLILRQYL